MNVEKSVAKEKKLFVGVGELSIKGFNFDREKSNEFFGYESKEDDKPLEYLAEKEIKTGEGENEVTEMCNQVTITVFCEELRTKTKHRLNFYLVDKQRVSKTGKLAFVNQLGMQSFVDDESNLADWFKEFSLKDKNDPSLVTTYPKEYRRALMGEENIYEFLVKWMDVNKFNTSNNVLLDTKKLLKGNMSELNSLVEEYSDRTVLVPFGIKTKDTEDGTKEVQVISNKFFLQGKFKKNWTNYQANNFEGLTAKTKFMYDVNKFHESLIDSENGFCKAADFVELAPIRDYVSGESPLSTDKAVVTSDNSSY